MEERRRKRIAVVTMDDEVVKFYAKELQYLFGEYADIDTYNVKDGSASHVGEADVYAISTCALKDNTEAERYLSNGDAVLLRMTITRKSLALLNAIPQGTKAMLVNLSLPMAIETMVLLNQLGVKNIDFTPVYPGIEAVPDLDLAVTPGEQRYVPSRVKRIVDIGHRVIDGNTMVELALKLRCDELLGEKKFLSYINDIADDSYSFDQLLGKSMRLEGQLSGLLSVLDIGLAGVDASGRVTIFNQKAEQVLGIARDKVIDREASEVLPFIPFEKCADADGEAITRLVQMREKVINLTLTSITSGEKRTGALAVVQCMEDEEKKQYMFRRQQGKQGYMAKYTFHDILGNSASIQAAIRNAGKMAVTHSAILISGESGTGKELFAHAIHNASTRRDAPFVAINCAAIPDNLFESELFGYEEGAFTGARKGGKVGLFELAHKGTLFLDEIEGISMALQVKLLRAIQEKEVLRVGGHKIISVDVRIIAATNENMAQMVREGKFRRDLYYRLNTLPLQLPPLRQRKDDILLLLDEKRRELGGDFVIAPETAELLLRYPWEGNIRELFNCVEYLIYTGGKTIHVEDLPPYFSEQEAFCDNRTLKKYCESFGSRREDYLFVLEQLSQAARDGRVTGRKNISEEAKQCGLFLTEQEVRRILVDLEDMGAAKLSRGRGGSRITSKGKELLRHLEQDG